MLLNAGFIDVKFHGWTGYKDFALDRGRICVGTQADPRSIRPEHMKATKAVGLGIGTVVAALASCHIVQAAVLGLLGGLGVLSFLERFPPALILAVFGCGALAVYGVIRLWRGRHAQLGLDGTHVR